MERGNGTLMGLMLRGSTWYYRRTVSPALRPFFNGRAEVWISLRTTSREDAKLKALKVGFEVERQLQEARKRLGNGAAPDSVAREWQRRALAADADWRQTATQTEDRLDAEIAALGDAIADHHESLSRRDTGIVSAVLDEVLAEQGLSIPAQDRQTFALSLLRSRLEALEVALGRATSRAKGEPASLVDEALTVEELVEAWAKDRQPHPKTETEWRAAARRFEAVNGRGLRVRQVTKGHVRAFKASLSALPSKLSQGGTLSPRTVRKALGALSSVFKWGVGQGYLDASPFTGLISVAQERGAGREDRRRLPYSLQDLTTIFNHPTFAAPVLHPTPAPRRFLVSEGVPAARYWLPILAAFTGARLEELGGLRVQDVRETGGVWHLNITPHELRGLKTATSRRAVPLHPEVLRLGFVAYVRNTPVSGRAFPDLLPGTHGNLTGAFSKYWARFSDECGITDRRTAFHSFRHGFKDACRGASISEEIHDALTGHRTVSVGRSYGLGVPLSALAEAVRKISYPGVVLRN